MSKIKYPNSVKTSLGKQKPARMVLFGLLVVLTLVWSAVFQTADSKLHIFVFDVGQGDAILVQKADQQVLIDGGPDTSVLSKLGQVMPFWDHKIEYLILTHPHADHLVGLVEVAKRYEVGQIISSDASHTTGEYLEWLKTIKDKNIPYQVAIKGEKWDVGDCQVICQKWEIFYPEESFKDKEISNLNNTSVVAKMVYGDFSVLLPGDAERGVLDEVTSKNDLDSTVLKVAHHGSDNGLTLKFLEAVSPELAVISVGQNNQYGHPGKSTLELLQNIEVLRTDQNGDIQLTSNGENFWIKTGK